MAGLGKILANPLVFSTLAANAANQTANAYNAAVNAPDPNDERFVLQSLASGGPVGEIAPKRGIFGKGLQALGILPDRIQATPDQLAKETLALRGQGAEGLDTAYKISEIGKNIGHTNLDDLMAGEFGKRMASLGVPETSFEAPFPNEMKKTNLQKVTEYGTQPGVPDRIEPMDTVMARGGTPAPGTAFRPPAKPPETPEHRKAMRAATIVGNVEGTLGLKPSEYSTVAKADLYDPDTYAPVTDRQLTAAGLKNVGEGIDKGYISVPRSEQHSVKEMGAAVGAMDDFIAAANAAAKTKNPLFVDTKGMNQAQARKAITANAVRIRGQEIPNWVPVVGGMNLWGAKGIDPKLAELYQQTMTVAIPSLYAVQHRYVSGAELKATADAFPNYLTDDLATAKAKYENIKRSATKSVWGGLRDAGTVENYRSAIDAADSAFEAEDIKGTEPDVTGADSRGPIIEPPTDEDIEGATP